MTVLIKHVAEAPAQWQVAEGSSVAKFIETRTTGKSAMTEAAMRTVVDSAKDILGHGAGPDDGERQAAVLVVGYVQSGKTLSFTTVTALARDNGFGVVILLAGTTNELKEQSEKRLETDLGLSDFQRQWRKLINPDLSNSHATATKTLASWKNYRAGKTLDEKPALICSVLKHSLRINNAADLFGKLDLAGVPVLIIDDESDQASLNTQARKNLLQGKNDESGTYESILNLRSAFPLHTFLQYTATPQANLLLATSDSLNPDYAKVIEAGSGYTGGRTFFLDRPELIVKVPDAEVLDIKQPFEEPPAMFQDALRYFVLAISAGANAVGATNRSMMIQPHQQVAAHKLYLNWVESLLGAWERGLSSEDESVLGELEVEFASAYKELKKTVPDAPPLRTLFQIAAERVPEIHPVAINSTKDAEKQIDWKSWEYWILVGGQKLDRGFTVEGLTVTYMPRNPSENSDVFQQRARFFGYRASYIDYCRIYVTADTRDAFVGYVKDEEFLRTSLVNHGDRPMKEWRRDFTLHEGITRPTRTNIVGRRHSALPLRQGWIWPKSMHIGRGAIEFNRSIFTEAMASLKESGALEDASTLPGVVDKRSDAHHTIAKDVPIAQVIDFLTAVRFSVLEDSMLATALGLAFAELQAPTSESVPPLGVDLVFMNELVQVAGKGRSIRVLRDNIAIGKNPNTGDGASVTYSGDQSFVRADAIAIQLRYLKVIPESGAVPIENVPWLSFYLPDRFKHRAWLEYE